MKSEEQVLQEINILKKQIQKNIKEYNAELERSHPLSAQVHWEYHQTLLGFRNALQWVLKDREEDKKK